MMQQKLKMEVKLLSKKLVKPSTPTPHSLHNFNISFIDQLLFPSYINVILYYPSTVDEHNVRVERRNSLEHSLSEVLTFYYPLAGRYDRNNLLINCNDDGVEFWEANVSCKLSQVLNEEFSMEQLNDLVPLQSESTSSPLLVAQFNIFECGGIAIGISFSHRVGDAFTFTAFVNGWATASREGKSKVYPPNFKLSSLFPARRVQVLSSTAKLPKGEAKLTLKRFVFSGTAIKSLKAIANAGASAAGCSESQFSRIEVVSAVIGKVCVLVSQALGRKWRPSFMAHAINLRQKIPLPTLDNPCGNLITTSTAGIVAEADGGGSNFQLHYIARNFHDSIRTKIMECAKSNPDELFLILGRNIEKHYATAMKNEGDLYLCSSWCRFPIYEADFGRGKPSWVSVAHVPFSNLIYLLDSKDGDGIEAFVSLEEDKMLLFQQNHDIIALTSSNCNMA